MSDEIQIPEITPAPVPEIQEDTKPVVEYIHLGEDVRKFRDTLLNVLEPLKYVPLVGWIIYGLFYAIIFVVFGIIIFIADLVDSLWNGTADVINAVAIWWKNFTRAVEERYHGNWWKAIIDMAVQFLLMYLLEKALNIKAIKQFWDIFVTVVQKINTFMMNLRNSVSAFFKNITDWVNNLPSNLNPLIKALFKDEIDFWTNQITSLTSTLESKLTKMISDVNTRLTAKADEIISTVNKLLQEWDNFKKEMQKKAVEATIDRLVWILIKMASPLSITIYEDKEKKKPITTYTFGPSQVEATYSTFDARRNDIYVNVSNLFLDFVNETFDDKSDVGKKLNEAIKNANDIHESLWKRDGLIISYRELIDDTNEMINKNTEELEKLQKEGVK